MKAIKLRELADEELLQQHGDTETELFNLRVRKATRQLDQPSRIRELRRNLARIKTVQRERAKAKG